MSETTTGTLSGFLLARFAEREKLAEANHDLLCLRIGCESCVFDDDPAAIARERVCTCGLPARVLAECARDRRIVALHSPVHVCTKDETGDDETAWDARYGSPCPTLRALASVYADHPDFREEWRP